MVDVRFELTTNDPWSVDHAICEGISPLGYWQKVNQSPTQTKPYNTMQRARRTAREDAKMSYPNRYIRGARAARIDGWLMAPNQSCCSFRSLYYDQYIFKSYTTIKI